MKHIIIGVLVIFINLTLRAQVPTGLPFQGYLSDENGSALVNSEVIFKFEYEPGSSNPYVVLDTIMTDANGVFSIFLDEGKEAIDSYNILDWATTDLELFIEYDLQDGNGFTRYVERDIGAVFFCLHSEYLIECQDGIEGPQGEIGPTGPQGPQGPQGEQGPQGPRGADAEALMAMRSNEPTSPIEGTVYLDNGLNRADSTPGFRYFNGSAWIDL